MILNLNNKYNHNYYNKRYKFKLFLKSLKWLLHEKAKIHLKMSLNIS